MENQSKTDAERQATERLLDYVESNLGALPVSVVAGALMRASVMLAIEVFGDRPGEAAAKRALRNILVQRKKRTLN